MSDDEYDTTCPLCVEEMDLSDQNFLPCPCGYKVCMWCWHHIRENLNGLCPACRTPYNSDPHAFSAVDREDVVKLKKEKKQKEKQEKKVAERIVVVPGIKTSASTVMDRKHLHNYRVVQRNLVYVIGVPAAYASEETLRKPEFFGQYGKIGKVVIHRNHSSVHTTVSVYVTFVHKEDAKASIQSLDGHWLDQNHLLRASFGTTKYCNNFIRGVPCNNPECVYLHDLGDDDDRFTKEEIQAGHSKIPPVPGKDQTLITGGGGPSGTGKRPAGEPVLPPPVFIQDNNPAPSAASSAASSAGATMGATMAPPGVPVPRPAAVSRSGTATWGSSNTIAAILSEGPGGSAADRMGGNSCTPVNNLSAPAGLNAPTAPSAASLASVEDFPAPSSSISASSAPPMSGIKRTASNASAAAPAELPVSASAPVATGPAVTASVPAATVAAPAAAVPTAKSKAKTAKEIAAEKKAAAAASKAAAVVQAAEAVGADGEAKATAPVTKLSARQQMQQARAAAKAAHQAEKAARAEAAAALASGAAGHDTQSNSSSATGSVSLAPGELTLPATSVQESPSVSAKKIIKRPDSKTNLSALGERTPSEDSLPRLTPSISNSALSALGLMSEVPQVPQPVGNARFAGFNGLSTNAVFPAPVSSLSCSVWAYIMRASNEDLSINPYGQLSTPFAELLDLTLPPVDALHSCAPMWPRPMGYYLQGMQTDGITYTAAGKHSHHSRDYSSQPPLVPANPTIYRPSPTPRAESLLSTLNQSSTEVAPKVETPVPALVPVASMTPPPPALTPVGAANAGGAGVAPLPSAVSASSAFQKPTSKGHKERNNHHSNSSSNQGSAAASPAPPNLSGLITAPAPVAAASVQAVTAPASAAGGSSAGISALRQLFPGVKMSVSGTNK